MTAKFLLKRALLLIAGISITATAKSQNIYFPPTTGNTWDTLSPASLGWCQNEIDSLYDFLQQENTKGFIVLKDGKIVLEKYFDTFTTDSLWYWASAGKTITAFLVGQAQENGFLSINDTTSTYLGAGWTNCTSTQEDKISIRHQLTMTTGLDDGVADNHCTIDSCLIYLADAGTRWAYHNAPYTLLEGVLTNATGQPINTFTQTYLKNTTGMTGFWLYSGYDNIYFSKARSMARFGILIQNQGIWNSDTLLHDTVYFNQMVNTSQSLNNSYGYLWWLNGKSSFMIPTLQTIFPGSYAPDAPSDMIAALGKNGQILSISQSQGLVVVRMGNQPNSPLADVPTWFCNQIWQKMNVVMCNTTFVSENNQGYENILVYPNPGHSYVSIKGLKSTVVDIEIINAVGQIVLQATNSTTLNISQLNTGFYLILVQENGITHRLKLFK